MTTPDTGEGRSDRDDGPRTDVSGVVWGTRVEGRMPAVFADHLRPGAEGWVPRRHLRVTYRRVPSVPNREMAWESEAGDADTPGRLTLEPTVDGFVLAAWGDERGVFEATADRIDVTWSGDDTAAAHHLFAYALPLWLETRRVPILHGGAVRLGDRAVAFLAPSGTGKSVLAAELVRRGASFLADDGLVLEPPSATPGPSDASPAWLCHPGPPLLRLWPSGLAGRLGLAADDLPRFHPAGDKRHLAPGGLGDSASPGSARPVPLAAVYVLQRRPAREGPISLQSLSAKAALLHFLEHGVAAGPAAALGLEKSRLEVLAGAAEALPVRRLSYPSGGSAGRVLETLRRDLATTAGASVPGGRQDG